MCNSDPESVRVWVEAPGFPNYKISNYAEVVRIKDCLFSPITNKVLKGWVGTQGYRMVTLKNQEGKRKTYRLHILVAKAFVPNPKNHPQVNHKDGNKLNCMPFNLEWSTQIDNLYHAYRTGLTPVKGYAFHKQAKKWRAYINVEGKHKHLGLTDTKEDAILLRRKAELKYFGFNFGSEIC